MNGAFLYEAVELKKVCQGLTVEGLLSCPADQRMAALQRGKKPVEVAWVASKWTGFGYDKWNHFEMMVSLWPHCQTAYVAARWYWAGWQSQGGAIFRVQWGQVTINWLLQVQIQTCHGFALQSWKYNGIVRFRKKTVSFCRSHQYSGKVRFHKKNTILFESHCMPVKYRALSREWPL